MLFKQVDLLYNLILDVFMYTGIGSLGTGVMDGCELPCRF